MGAKVNRLSCSITLSSSPGPARGAGGGLAAPPPACQPWRPARGVHEVAGPRGPSPSPNPCARLPAPSQRPHVLSNSLQKHLPSLPAELRSPGPRLAPTPGHLTRLRGPRTSLWALAGPARGCPGTPHSLCVSPPAQGGLAPPGPGPAASRPHAVCGLHPLSSISPGLSPRLLGRWVPDAGPLLPLRSHLPRRGPPSHRASPLSWRCSAGPPSPGASLPEPWPPSDGLRRRPQSGPVGPSGLRSWR